MLLLESKTRAAPTSASHYYDAGLPDTLRALTLSEDEQAAIVWELHRLVLAATNERSRVALLSALSAVAPWLGLDPVLELLVEQRERFSDRELHQLLMAVNIMLDLLTVPPTHQHYEHVERARTLLRDHGASSALEQIAASSNSMIREQASDLRDRVTSSVRTRLRVQSKWQVRLRPRRPAGRRVPAERVGGEGDTERRTQYQPPGPGSGRDGPAGEQRAEQHAQAGVPDGVLRTSSFSREY